MSKGLDASECSLKLYKMVESAGNDNGFNLNEAWEYHKIIKQALERLEAIDNANPSEALKALDRNIVVIREKDYTIIEQALLKAQEQEDKNEVLEACIKDWEDDYEHLEFYFKNREKALEILKKYLYYDNKNHAIKMKEVRKSIYNFDYEDLKEMLRK